MQEQVNKYPRYRALENFHIVLWLFKDLCWCSNAKTMGLLLIIPTLLLAIYILYLHWSEKVERLHNAAVVCWICANSVWMLGEFYFEDGLRDYALLFFISGIICISYYYLSELFLKVNQKKIAE